MKRRDLSTCLWHHQPNARAPLESRCLGEARVSGTMVSDDRDRTSVEDAALEKRIHDSTQTLQRVASGTSMDRGQSCTAGAAALSSRPSPADFAPRSLRPNLTSYPRERSSLQWKREGKGAMWSQKFVRILQAALTASVLAIP